MMVQGLWWYSMSTRYSVEVEINFQFYVANMKTNTITCIGKAFLLPCSPTTVVHSSVLKWIESNLDIQWSLFNVMYAGVKQQV